MPITKKGQAPAFQPFQCHICQSRFTRHENLKRHSALHSRSRDETWALPCDLCAATFSRPDLRHRHMKKKHPDAFGEQPQPQQQRDDRSQRRLRQQHQRQNQQAAPSPSTGSTSSEGGDDTAATRDSRVFADMLLSRQTTSTSMPEESMMSIGNNQGLPDVTMDMEPHIMPMSLPTGMSSLLDPVQGFGTGTSPFGSASLSNGGFSFPDDGMLPMDFSLSPMFKDEWMPSAAQTAHGCELFFTHVSHFVPFLHQPTFDSSLAANHLVLAMLSLAYQYGDDPDSCSANSPPSPASSSSSSAPSSGEALSKRCFQRARALVAREERNNRSDEHHDDDDDDHSINNENHDEENASDKEAQNTALVQTYLLLEIYAMMYLCGRRDSSYALKTHSRMISLARSSSLVQPLPPPSHSTSNQHPPSDLDSLWRHVFAATESRKRTMFAAHQIDTLWYQFLSIPRSLSHLEIKHELPCPETLWSANTAAEWAHAQLVSRHSSCSSTSSSSLVVPYPDAIRRFLSSSPQDISSIPSFDPYGAINVTHFLVSSAREISGWSTMTGMLSLERLHPLRSSLLALDSFIRPSPPSSSSSSSQKHLCEATWETAMIEMQMWSPSHTGGLVQGTMDAVLRQLTRLPSCCDPDAAAVAVQPHIDWFLRYLDDDAPMTGEAPWVTLYAYKAFMIAWQLVQAGVPDAMQTVGVQDGDVQAALAWGRKVFGRRTRWQLGRIAMSCLDSLGDQPAQYNM